MCYALCLLLPLSVNAGCLLYYFEHFVFRRSASLQPIDGRYSADFVGGMLGGDVCQALLIAIELDEIF